MENINSSPNSYNNLSQIQNTPQRNFFPTSNPNNLLLKTPEKNHFNPIASSLNSYNKHSLDSVRKSLINENMGTMNEIDVDEPKPIEIDESSLALKPRKTNFSNKVTSFANKVSTLMIPSSKNSKESIFTIEKFKSLLERTINNNYTMAFITMLTIFCLFGDDCRTAFVSKDYDLVFNIISIICIVIFSLEIIISIVVKPDYYLSFFFWLDLVSALSIMLDLVWIQNLIVMGGANSNITRASRFSKFGAKMGRLIRLVRLFRIVKLYKTVFEKQREKEIKEIIEIQRNSIFTKDISIKSANSIKDKKKKSLDKASRGLNNADKHISIFCSSNSTEKWYLSPTLREIYRKSNDPKLSGSINSALSRSPEFLNNSSLLVNPNRDPNQADEEEETVSESRVGKKLTDLTIKRVLILVFIMIFVVPLFTSNYWYDPTLSYDIGLKMIRNYTITMNNTDYSFTDNDTILTSLCNSYININTNTTYPLILLITPLRSNPACQYNNSDINDMLRDEEKDMVTIDDYEAVINKKSNVVDNSYISISRTIFVCLILGIGALCFARDAHILVLRPIERMLTKVNNISKNPLASKYQKLIEKHDDSDGKEQDMETTFIENAIVKISTLLALGLGDAGAEIITSNIAKMGDLVCITPGSKRFGIFGFCDIRNFTDTTEALQEEVMIFVNNIAEIVHMIVDRFQGSANKNIGDAFLLVWKFRLEDSSYINDRLNKANNEIKLVKSSTPAKPTDYAYLTDLSDLALMSFLKIICKLNSKAKILKYRENVTLNQRLNGYKVKMGFGLHLGWAIEGSIGSDYKIDASYLSPNVNIASRLEAATKQYGVPLLISEALYEFLSYKMKEICRRIDYVTMKGSNIPINLYTVDLQIDRLVEKPISNKTLKQRREINALKKMGYAFGLDNKTFNFDEVFNYDKDMMIAYIPLDENFKGCFRLGLENYLHGCWEEAGELLNKALILKENDGPCKAILEIIEKKGYKSPEDWKGYREMVEK